MSTWEAIGHGVRIKMRTDAQDRFVGLLWQHDGCVLGEDSGDLVAFDKPWVKSSESYAGRPLWEVEQWEPLTLSPSLLCQGCGRHGFIREGRWVPVEEAAR